jgi:hypothetical protein
MAGLIQHCLGVLRVFSLCAVSPKKLSKPGMKPPEWETNCGEKVFPADN